MDTLQNSLGMINFLIQSVQDKFIFFLLLAGSIYIRNSKSLRQLALMTGALSFYAAVIVPIMNWNSGAYKCIAQGDKIIRGGLDFCREGMYAWYGENLWQWAFGIAIALIFIGYFYINRDRY